MKTSIENNTLTIFLEGRIDTSNAAQTEKEIFDAAGDRTDIVIDAAALEYISSAGLRVLMKLRKSINKPLPIRNVSRDVYDIFETTGFTELFDVKKALRKVSVSGCECIGRDGHGNVYRLDEETIIKVYHDNSPMSLIEKEREYAKNAFVHGVPSAIAYDIVETEEGCGLVFEMAGAVTLSRFMTDHPERLQEYAVKFGTLLKTLDNTEADPKLYGDIKEIYLGRAKNTGKFFTDDEVGQLVKMINAVPDGSGMIHGDYHTNNVMVQPDGELVLIDMPEVTVGAKIWDIAGIYRDMISAPQNSSDVIETSVGMPSELIIDVGHRFFKAYTGMTDAELEEYFKQLGLVFALNVVLITGADSKQAVARASVIMDNLLRKVVIPNEQALRHILRS